MRSRRFWIAMLALAMAAPALAQRQKSLIPETDDDSRRGEIARAAQEKAGKRFQVADANQDKKLTREEVAAHYQYMAESFERHDKDGDGFLDWKEFVGHDRWDQPQY